MLAELVHLIWCDIADVGFVVFPRRLLRVFTLIEVVDGIVITGIVQATEFIVERSNGVVPATDCIRRIARTSELNEVLV